MKKISVVTGMILVMLVIMVFPCSGADVIYYGCYQKNNGQLRIVGSSNECRPPEVSIYWNKVGPQGPTGPAGLMGPAGPTGATGPQGPAGTISQEVMDTICQLVISGNILQCPSFCNCSKYVFVSSKTYTGNLGGLLGADAKCQELAGAAGIIGTFKAWLSDSNQGPATRFSRTSFPYQCADGSVVANNTVDLFDGVLAHPINIDENGDPIISGETSLVWSNTRIDGAPRATDPWGTCYDWESTSLNATYASYGDSNLFGNGWTGLSYWVCSNRARLYCFEQ